MPQRSIEFDRIVDAVAEMCQTANFDLSQDMREALRDAADGEEKPLARNTLLRILDNSVLAEEKRVPMCQDTGLVVVFADVGESARVVGGGLRNAIDAGVRLGYRAGYLRASVVGDPILRENTGDNTPAVVYTEVVDGDRLRLRLLAKGGGCENMSRFRMLTPAEGPNAVVDFVVEAACAAGPNACPPMVVGVGVGGSFDYSAVLSKKSLLREIGSPNPLPHVAALERKIHEAINASGIGPQGYGGNTTSLAVQIETAACHMASLPVSVNIECHAHRHREVVL